MLHRQKIVLLCWLSVLFFMFNLNKFHCKKEIYLNLERPKLDFYDEEYFWNASFTARRISRSDPLHYGNLTYYLRKPLDNSFVNNFYVYQLLSNVYKRSFVEMHFGTCDLFKTDNMFGVFLAPAFYKQPKTERPAKLTCPLSVGYYRFLNIQLIPKSVPKNFPFDEGRVYYNLTTGSRSIANVHIDFSLVLH